MLSVADDGVGRCRVRSLGSVASAPGRLRALKGKGHATQSDRVPVPGAPDIAIEVISPTERAVESHDKIRAYLRNGAIEAWQVFPRSRTVEVYNVSGSTIFDSTQSVASSLLPDLNLPVASLFE